MCLIITAAAAVISTLLWRLKFRASRYKLDILSLMYWGAALMWCVDSVFSAVEGGGFFEFSASDAMLGILAVAAGLVLWAIIYLCAKAKAKTKNS